MKKILCLSIAGALTIGNMQAQTAEFTNPDMETWISIGTPLSLERPAGFHGSDSTLRGMSLILTGLGYPITPVKQLNKSADAFGGEYAAHIITKNLGTSFGNTPAILANGPIEVDMAAAAAIAAGGTGSITDLLKIKGGTATYFRKVDSVVAYVKAPLTNEDSAITLINAHRTVDGEYTIIGNGRAIIEPAADYQKVVIHLDYLSDALIGTDTLTIMFVSSFSMVPPSGTGAIFEFNENNELFIDDLKIFTSPATSIMNPYAVTDLGIEVFPIPASNQIHFNNRNNITNGQLVIFNLQGQIMHEAQLDGDMNTIDIQHWPAGMYTYEIYDAKQVQRQLGKFTK